MSALRALLLIGSARPRGSSNSEALGGYLGERLQAGGADVDVMHVAHVRDRRLEERLLPALDAADLWVLASPVYADSLPSLVTRCFERVAAHRRALPSPSGTRFLAILNCGFPEAVNTETALAICRCFAREAGLRWAGGLGLGGGETLGGRPLESLGFLARDVRRSLDLTAEALLGGCDVPEEAFLRMRQPMLPAPVYSLVANLSSLRQAWGHHALRELRARPYQG